MRRRRPKRRRRTAPEAQLELPGLEPVWVCPLYGCRKGCVCSPEKRAETKAALEAGRTRPGRPASNAGPSDWIPY
jgi:hypothetical protein